MNTEVTNVLIVSCDHGVSQQEMMRANLVICMWLSPTTAYSSPYFTIVKNRWGKADQTRHIPIDLLPKVLQNPEGNLDWL